MGVGDVLAQVGVGVAGLRRLDDRKGLAAARDGAPVDGRAVRVLPGRDVRAVLDRAGRGIPTLAAARRRIVVYRVRAGRRHHAIVHLSLIHISEPTRLLSISYA